MKTFRIAFAVLALAFGSTGWGQSVFLKYGPVAGIQKSTGSTYQNTAAASSDVIGLWSGCTGSNFLRGDGTCTVPAGTGVSSVAVPAPLTATSCSGGACVLSWTTGQTANRILATPDATTGAVSLRAMVAGDVPPINLGSTANGGVSSATILLGTNGGTSNGFFSVTGPTTALRTFTFPNASATVLTSNAAVTVPQGGTGLATLTANGVLLGEGTSNVNPLVMGADTVLRGTASADPVAAAVPNCGSSTTALNYNTTTHAFGCQTISAGGTGTVTNVATGTGLTGGPITTTGTLSVDQTSSLTWTGNEVFTTQTFISGAGTSLNPLSFCANGLTTTNRCWTWRVGSGADLLLDLANDAGTPGSTVLDITRAANVVSGITLGNSTDLPIVTVPGGILAQGGRPSFSTGTSTVALGATAGGLAQISLVDSAGATDSKAWDTFVDTTAQHFRLINDANNSSTEWLTVTRSGMTVSNITGPGGASMFPAAGTYTATYVGNGGIALSANYSRSGNIACLIIPAGVGASTTTGLTMSGFPVVVQPATTQVLTFAPVGEDNSVIAGFTLTATISGSTMTFQKNNNSSGWTASNQKGIASTTSACYPLN